MNGKWFKSPENDINIFQFFFSILLLHVSVMLVRLSYALCYAVASMTLRRSCHKVFKQTFFFFLKSYAYPVSISFMCFASSLSFTFLKHYGSRSIQSSPKSISKLGHSESTKPKNLVLHKSSHMLFLRWSNKKGVKIASIVHFDAIQREQIFDRQSSSGRVEIFPFFIIKNVSSILRSYVSKYCVYGI